MLFKKKLTKSSDFADFMHKASSRKKKKVYRRVLGSASESQKEIVEKAKAIDDCEMTLV